MSLLQEGADCDRLVESMVPVSNELVPAVAALDAERVRELLAPYGLTETQALVIAQAAQIRRLKLRAMRNGGRR